MLRELASIFIAYAVVGTIWLLVFCLLAHAILSKPDNIEKRAGKVVLIGTVLPVGFLAVGGFPIEAFAIAIPALVAWPAYREFLDYRRRVNQSR